MKRTPVGPVVLGVDPGSHNTGYAFLSSCQGRAQALAYGAIRCDAKEELADRLLHIVRELEKLIRLHAPSHLCMESAFFAKNARSALVLGHVRGAVMALCRSQGMTFSEITPSEVKKAVTGSGSASKERVASMMERLLDLPGIEGPLDASDALAIAWTHLRPSPLSQALSGIRSSPKALRLAKTQLSPLPKAQGLVATALPKGMDARAFLLAHARTRKKRP